MATNADGSIFPRSAPVKIKGWLAAGVLVGAFGTAPAQWRENGVLTPDSAWRKAWGPHGAMLQLTDAAEELFAAWEQGAPGAGVHYSTTETARRGDPIFGVVFFTGCSPNQAGNCDAEVHFQVFKPDGSAYGAEEKAELWSGKPPPLDGHIQLGVGAIGVRIEPQDPTGTYTVRARLRDGVSDAKVELRRTFRVEQ